MSSGGLGVSAGDDGSSLLVWETSQGVVRVGSKNEIPILAAVVPHSFVSLINIFNS